MPLFSSGSDASQFASNLGPAIEIVNVMQPGFGNVGIVSFYAAGIGVMFLLFSSSGAGGSLLDEEETGKGIRAYIEADQHPSVDNSGPTAASPDRLEAERTGARRGRKPGPSSRTAGARRPA